jgi:hypothetical protein
MENKKTTDLGAITGIIIVVIVLLVGAFYFAQQRLEKQKEFQASLSTTSDNLTDIENSANSMNFDDLGSGIDNL